MILELGQAGHRGDSLSTADSRSTYFTDSCPVAGDDGIVVGAGGWHGGAFRLPEQCGQHMVYGVGFCLDGAVGRGRSSEPSCPFSLQYSPLHF